MIRKLFYLSFAVTLVSWLACNKASDISAIIEENKEIYVAATQLPFNTTVVPVDSVLTYSTNIFTTTFFSGALDDPYFGKSKASLNFQVGINEEPDFTDAILDSVILTIAYDTVRSIYGPSTSPLAFEIYEITRDLDLDSTYYSNAPIDVEAEPIGFIDGLYPRTKSDVTVVEPDNETGRDTVLIRPHVRIPLTEAFGQKLLNLTPDDFASNAIFREKVQGIRVQPVSDDGGMVYFIIYNTYSRVSLYYTQNDTAKLMNFPVRNDNLAFNTFENEADGYPVGNLYNDESSADSLLFVQCMQGPDVRIELTDLSALEGRTVNHAEITFNMTYISGDDTASYQPIDQFILYEEGSQGQRLLVQDAALAIDAGSITLFGGSPTINSDNSVSYTMLITEQVRDILSGDATNVMTLSALSKGSAPHRSTLFGASSQSVSAAKISVTFSEF